MKIELTATKVGYFPSTMGCRVQPLWLILLFPNLDLTAGSEDLE